MNEPVKKILSDWTNLILKYNDTRCLVSYDDYKDFVAELCYDLSQKKVYSLEEVVDYITEEIHKCSPAGFVKPKVDIADYSEDTNCITIMLYFYGENTMILTHATTDIKIINDKYEKELIELVGERLYNNWKNVQ